MVKKAIFDKKNILVIGGAGFIGSFLCDELVKTSKVICIDNYISGRIENIEHLLGNANFIFIKHDAAEPIDLEKFPELDKFKIKFQGVQEVYNLACPTIKKDFEKNIVNTLLANSKVVYNSLEVARTYQAKYLLASSSSVYGNPLAGQEEMTEDYWGFVDPVGLRSCYNEGKRFAEAFTINYGRQYNLETKIARIFNTYGPRMRLNSGRMIPDFVQSAANNQAVVIYGDGSEQDSYCYVADIIDGLIKFMTASKTGVINFGGAEKYRIIDIANSIIQLTDSHSNIKFDAKLPFIIRAGRANITKAKTELSWIPVTNLATGLKKTVDDMLGSRVLSYASVMNNLTNNES
ncbi:MAG: NAD-dependent epimerase/dehydratase family protein [Patescibacteria group bacterium]